MVPTSDTQKNVNFPYTEWRIEQLEVEIIQLIEIIAYFEQEKLHREKQKERFEKYLKKKKEEAAEK